MPLDKNVLSPEQAAVIIMLARSEVNCENS